jgi:chemotaxis response regulator CheB
MGPVLQTSSTARSACEEIPMEKTTRVLVANRPKLMREVTLAALADQPGIEIVGEVSDEKEIVAAVQATRPNLLVIALDEGEQRPPICDQVLRAHPALRIVAVAPRKDRTLYFWASFDIHCTDIESSVAGLLSVVHQSAESGRAQL